MYKKGENVMKKLLSVFAVVALVFCVAGCAKETTSKKENTKLAELQEILEETRFDTGVVRFEGKTFGEVVDEVIKVDPEMNDVYYRINEEINDFDSIKYDIPGYSAEQYDYILASVGFNAPMFNDYAYEEMLFKIDKSTKEVTPVGNASSGGEWSFNGEDSINVSCMMMSFAFSN